MSDKKGTIHLFTVHRLYNTPHYNTDLELHSHAGAPNFFKAWNFRNEL